MKSNVDVSKPNLGEKIIMLNVVKKKKRSGQMFGRLLKHDSLVTNVFEGRINGHGGRGAPKEACI